MGSNSIGSIWRRWDLHLHTPGTQKNDQFEGTDIDNKWSKFIDTINAYSGEVPAIGITDYLSIDNFERFQIEKAAITKDIGIVLPNVEMRMVPVTGSSTPINIHCIFNPAIAQELESQFFSKLHLNTDDSISASKQDLMRLGRSSTEETLTDDVAYKKGIEQFIVDFNGFKKLFKDNPELKANTIVVVANSSSDGASGITEHYRLFDGSGSQLDTVRANIYKMSDAIFSSFAKDREYFCGKKIGGDGKLIDKAAVVKKVGTLKPCFHGSDAHTNAKVFEPDQRRYCWVKSELSFEGLKQSLYEPELRVRVQETSPELEHKKIVISEISIKNPKKFKLPTQTIQLNRDLVTFIGGRGSGKSMFLETLASLNEAHTPYDTNGKPKVIQSMRDSGAQADLSVKITNKDGDVESFSKKLTEATNLNLPILYIGQERLSQIATDDDELTPTVLSFLGIEENSVDSSLVDKTIPYDIERIKISTDVIDSLKRKYAPKPDQLDFALPARFDELEQAKSEQIKRLSSEQTEQLVTEMVSIIRRGQKIKNYTDKLPLLEHQLGEISINKDIKSTNDALTETAFTALNPIPEIETTPQKQAIEANKELLRVERERLSAEYRRITTELKALGIKEDVRLLTESIRKLQDEINTITKDRKIYEEAEENLNDYRGELEAMGQALQNFISWAVKAIDKAFTTFKDTSELLGDAEKGIFEKVIEGVDVEGSVVLDEDAFFGILKRECFDSRTIKDSVTIRRIFTNKGKLTFEDYISFWKEGKIWPAIKANKFNKSGEEKLVEIFFTRWREFITVSTKISLNGVSIENLSVGQRGTLLLKLYLASATDKQIFIIDQPEDNLDNKFISEQMVPMLREIKKTRQVIVSTHNANIVVGCDADQVVIAKLDERLISDREYASGGIENPEINTSIQTILEGGSVALKERYRRYF